MDLGEGKAILHKTKNGDKRVIAIVEPVIGELRKLRKVRRIDDDLVFAKPNRSQNRDFRTFDEEWRFAREAAGLNDFRFHDCRHTFASYMAMDGHSLAEIAGALGHRTLAMVQRYSHLSDTHIHGAMMSTAKTVLRP